jgi:hypothetical protein
MWYSPNFSSIQEFNSSGNLIYLSYLQTEFFIRNIFASTVSEYNGLTNFTLTINYNDLQFYFQYPSQVEEKFNSTSASVITELYTCTIFNYRLNNFLVTSFVRGPTLYLCVTLLFQSNVSPNTTNEEPGGVACIGLETMKVFMDIVEVLGISDFQLSTNNYYFLRPTNEFEGDPSPQIIANFTSTNLNDLYTPAKEFFDL